MGDFPKFGHILGVKCDKVVDFPKSGHICDVMFFLLKNGLVLVTKKT